jgi:hypothetical protein
MVAATTTITFCLAQNLTYSGAATISQVYGLAGPGAVMLNGNTPPRTNACAAGASRGGQVF